MRWMDVAWTQVGQQEVSGGAANPQIVAYFADAGHPEIVSDEVSWCAAFAGYCLLHGGVPASALPAKAERLRARAYLDFGTPIDEPRVGAVAVFSRGSDPEQGHVGFVTGVTADAIVIIGGNQGAKGIVSVTHMPRARLVGLRWPAAEARPKDLAASGSRIVAASSRQVADGARGGVLQALPPPPKLPSADALIGKASAFRGTVETALDFAAFAGKKWPLLLLAVGGYFGARMIYDAVRVRGWRVEDHNTGANVQPEGNNVDPA